MFSATWLLQMACVGRFHLRSTMAFIWMKSVILIVMIENSLQISCVPLEALVVLYLNMLLTSWQSCWKVGLVSLRSIFRLSRILQVFPVKPNLSDAHTPYECDVSSHFILLMLSTVGQQEKQEKLSSWCSDQAGSYIILTARQFAWHLTPNKSTATPSLGPKFGGVIGTRANKGQGMFPWLL